MSKLQPFHLAIPVSNLEKNRIFYRKTLGCTEGRSSDQWVDFNFFGHQLVLHEQQSQTSPAIKGNPVDGKEVPIPHFGVVLEWEVFHVFPALLYADQPGKTERTFDFVYSFRKRKHQINRGRK